MYYRSVMELPMRKQLNTYYKHDQNHGEEMRSEVTTTTKNLLEIFAD